MYLLHAPLPADWAILAWILLLPFALHSLLRLRSAEVLHGAQQHLWLAGVVLLAWLWTLQGRLTGGAAFGLLGVAFYSLIVGSHWARLGLLLAVALTVGSSANLALTRVVMVASSMYSPIVDWSRVTAHPARFVPSSPVRTNAAILKLFMITP